MSLQESRLMCLKAHTQRISLYEITSAVERSPNDGLQGLLVRCVLHFAHIASGAVRLEREKLLFERVEQAARMVLGIGCRR